MAETVSTAPETGAFDQFLSDFEQTIRSASVRLQEISAEKSSESPRGKWSRKQIVGHLIDSAATNHQRFVRSLLTDDLVFLDYEQERWVNTQKYTDESWSDLIDLWRAYNLHLLHVVSNIPEPVLMKPRAQRNLNQIASQSVDQSEPTTLDYFVRDYLVHMKHHLDQIFS